MKEEILKKMKEVGPNDPFLVTVTVFDKKKIGELNTFVYANNFPYEEMDGTKKMIGELIDKEKSDKDGKK